MDAAGAPRLAPSTRFSKGADALLAAKPRVGIGGLLMSLDRVAAPSWAPGSRVTWSVGWDRDDDRSERWYPQGVTSSSDARLPGAAAPDLPPLLVMSSYAKRLRGTEHGCRLTVADLSDPDHVRYAHVLLVRGSRGPWDDASVQQVIAHAGGVVWHGDWVYVAATRAGLLGFRLSDVVRTPALGHDHVLPLRVEWRPAAADTSDTADTADTADMRYSYLSLARSADDGQAWLVAGEYDLEGRPGHTRIVRFRLAPDGSLCTDADGVAQAEHVADGPAKAQGAVLHPSGELAVSTSQGKQRRGHLWVGRPGELRQLRGALPIGPEALAWWPERRELWTVTEHPGMRVAAAVAPPW